MRMKRPMTMPRLKGFRFPREIIAYAVWAYHRFTLSTADVEDLLAERGVTVSRESVRQWINRFGRHFADWIRCDRPAAADKWHMDEVVISMGVENIGSGGRLMPMATCSIFWCRGTAMRKPPDAHDLWNGYALELTT